MGLPCEVREMILGELLTLRQVDKVITEPSNTFETMMQANTDMAN